MKKNFKCKKENLQKEIVSNNLSIAKKAFFALFGTAVVAVNVFGATPLAIVGVPIGIGLSVVGITGMIKFIKENKKLNLELEKLSKKSERKR